MIVVMARTDSANFLLRYYDSIIAEMTVNWLARLRVRSRLNAAPVRGQKVKVNGVMREGFSSYQAAIYYANVLPASHSIHGLNI
jgi:hypothetical protein